MKKSTRPWKGKGQNKTETKRETRNDLVFLRTARRSSRLLVARRSLLWRQSFRFRFCFSSFLRRFFGFLLSREIFIYFSEKFSFFLFLFSPFLCRVVSFPAISCLVRVYYLYFFHDRPLHSSTNLEIPDPSPNLTRDFNMWFCFFCFLSPRRTLKLKSWRTNKKLETNNNVLIYL